MPDMLVNLLKLPPLEPAVRRVEQAGVTVRRAQPWEQTIVRRFVAEHFSNAWADEISAGFAHQPVTVFVATLDRAPVGFAAYECTRKDFFGPTGVAECERGRGVGAALLLACLWGLREAGYVYGIIGGAGPTQFYERAVGAIVIPDSEPGIYTDLLRADDAEA